MNLEVVLLVVVIALIIGGAIYWLHTAKGKAELDLLHSRLDGIKGQIDQVIHRNTANDAAPSPTPPAPPPVVVVQPPTPAPAPSPTPAPAADPVPAPAPVLTPAPALAPTQAPLPAPTPLPPAPAGTPTVPIAQPELGGSQASPRSVVLPSGVVGCFNLPVNPPEYNSGRLAFSIGTMSPPGGLILEVCISKNQGEINPALGRNYLIVNPFIYMSEMGWLTKPGIAPVGMAAEYADCSDPGPWYVNVRMSYPAAGNYGLAMIWLRGPTF